MGLLAWLGFNQADEYPNLDALVAEVRRALPDEEGVVRRYISIVIVLLGKVAFADGRFSEAEEAGLRTLLARLDRIAPAGVDAMCAVLRGKVPELTDKEMSLCYRELKGLCDAKERLEVVHLLTDLAAADGNMTEDEERELRTIAHELGTPEPEVDTMVRESRV